MERQSLSVSPVAELIVRIAEQKESCSLQLADRGLRIVAGELVDVSASESDLELPEFLVRSGRLRAEQRAELAARCAAEGCSFLELLRGAALLPELELKAQQRALWLERVTRALRAHGVAPLPDNCRSPLRDGAAGNGMRARLVPILLDAQSRLALDADASEIGRRLDQRLAFVERAALPEAKRWASFGELPDKPVVAALLAKLPACAPHIAALLRAGLAVLETASPGRATSSLPAPTLPPPPSRFSRLPLINWASKPISTEQMPAAVSGRRIRLEPGGAGDRIDEIPEVAKVVWPKRLSALADPLREPELELVEEVEPARRAGLFMKLAELWEQRIGSLEEASRNLREAAAAQPEAASLLLMAADACARVGHGEVALRYAGAALPLCSDAAQRARAQRLIAHLHERLEQHDAAVFCLTEAASEHAGEAWPHERLAQLALERDQLTLATAHLRAAANAECVRAPRRALAMYALAYGWDPRDAELAGEYADALQALGHPEAAIAIVAQTARNAERGTDPELLARAARRAERHGRSDLAAELWLEHLSLAPDTRAAWESLETCLAGPDTAAKLAVVRESRARLAATAAERAERLLSASRALDRFPSERAAAERYARLAELARRAEPPAPGQELDARSEAGRVRRLARREESAEAQQALLRQLAGLYAEAGEPRGVVSACLELLALDGDDPIAAARLWLAAAQLTDAVVRSEALTMLTRVQSGRARARMLAGLAREQERLNDFDAALAAAEASLFIDGSGADAVLIALGHLHRGTPERALALLAQAQRTLAAPPAVLLSTAEAAAAAGDTIQARRALEQLLEQLPDHAPARSLLLEQLLAGDDAASIAACARALVSHCSSLQLDRQAHDAARRLAELGEHAAAAELAEQLLCRHGRLDAELADFAYELAHESGQGALQIRALERAASAHSGAARAACLFQLATRHAAGADRVAELRALLRAAALPEGRARALEQLGPRFAELGDLERLLTVLSLRLDATADPAARRALLFEMACAAVSFSEDRVRALSFVRSMLVESGGERQALLYGLGAVFALGDASWALSAARELALEQSPEVAGALFLWLAHKAELGEHGTELALSLALEGAERFPATGELLVMAERLTLARGDKSGALALYAALLASSCGAHGQRALHYRAGRWLERFGASLEALDHYQQAFDLAPSAGVVFTALVRCARSAGELEVLLSAQHNLSLLATSERQRTGLLSAAVHTALHELHAPARALELLLEAEAFIPIGELDTLIIEAARAANPSDSEASLRELVKLRAERIEQLWDRDARADALLGLARLWSSALGDAGAAALTLRGLIEGELAQQLSAAQLQRARAEYDRLAQHGGPVRPSAPPVSVAPAQHSARLSEQELRDRAQAGDRDALQALVERLSDEPAYEEEAFALLAQLVRREPQRTAALRELAVRAQRAGASAQARICEQVLSLFDARYQAHPRVVFGQRDLPAEELWPVLAPERAAGLSRLLDLIWQHARLLPQLRPAARFQALGEASTPSDERHILSAFARVTSMLGRSNAVLHVKNNVAQEVSALPGPPATLVVRSGLTDVASLEFQLARALVACEPEHALVSALNERAARRLFTAVSLAFGTPSAETPLGLSDRALSLQLRATVAKPTQRELRQLLGEHAAQLDYARLRQGTELAAVRAGLLVSGDVRGSLLTLARTQSSLNECDVSSETGYARACVENAAFAEIVRSALSLPFIGLTELALPAHLEQSA